MFSKKPDRGYEKPELEESDRRLKEEIEKQIIDTTEPFKIQPRDRNLLRDRPTKLNLKQFELVNEVEFDNDPTLNRPKGVMDFLDPACSLKDGIIESSRKGRRGRRLRQLLRDFYAGAERQLDSISENVLHLGYQPSIGHESSSLRYLRYYQTDAKYSYSDRGYIVIGTGPQKQAVDEDVITKLKNYGVRFDVLDTVAMN